MLRFCCNEFKEAYYRQDGEYPQIKIVKCDSALRVRYQGRYIYRFVRVFFNDGISNNPNSHWKEIEDCPYCGRSTYWLKRFKLPLYDHDKYVTEIEGETIRFGYVETYKQCAENITMK